jgi:heptosyltransferase II
MNTAYSHILVVQTAFIGDVILTLPLIQTLKKNYPVAQIDVVVVPRTAELFFNHPDVTNIFAYDKQNSDRGIAGFFRFRKKLLTQQYDLIIVPHRSLRSAVLTASLRPAKSICFDRSAGSWLFDLQVRYKSEWHEIDRNLSLLQPLGIRDDMSEVPRLFPSNEDRKTIDDLLKNWGLGNNCVVAFAPGSIWATKCWLPERFADAAKYFVQQKIGVVLIGGKEDRQLCENIRSQAGNDGVVVSAGDLSLLQSAELLRRCKVLLSNDSAPLHLATAVQTPVVAIFGPTIPEFGFAPRGKHDVVLGVEGLACRPCAIHGGNRCPIRTFDCMYNMSVQTVVRAIENIFRSTPCVDHDLTSKTD